MSPPRVKFSATITNMVWENLKESLIVTNLEAKDQSDVFSALGNLLIEQGYAKESYVDALNEREKDFPTGLNIDGFGVAIPHTDASHVNKSITAIATLKKPVDWIHLGSADDHVDVSVVFMLAVKDPNEHLENLQRIVSILQDKSVMQSVLAASDKQEIINIIKEKEKCLEK